MQSGLKNFTFGSKFAFKTFFGSKIPGFWRFFMFFGKVVSEDPATVLPALTMLVTESAQAGVVFPRRRWRMCVGSAPGPKSRAQTFRRRLIIPICRAWLTIYVWWAPGQQATRCRLAGSRLTETQRVKLLTSARAVIALVLWQQRTEMSQRARVSQPPVVLVSPPV